MPRTLLPFAVADISALARSLRDQLSARTGPPGHVEMLNMLARAAGYRNFQQFRTQTDIKAATAPSAPPDLPPAASSFSISSREFLSFSADMPLWSRGAPGGALPC